MAVAASVEEASTVAAASVVAEVDAKLAKYRNHRAGRGNALRFFYEGLRARTVSEKF